jgi:uncharacterized protein YqgC (DUF456 family)
VFWLLLAAGLVGLFLTALGLPGLWIFLAVALGVQLFAPDAPIGWPALGIATVLAGIGELFELWAGLRYTRKYGGSRRAGWGALIGGLIGAIVGVPVPVIGSVIGSFVGSFAGALLLEYTARRDEAHAGRVAWGAVVGRVVATAAKMALGTAMVVVVLYAVWRR